MSRMFNVQMFTLPPNQTNCTAEVPGQPQRRLLQQWKNLHHHLLNLLHLHLHHLLKTHHLHLHLLHLWRNLPHLQKHLQKHLQSRLLPALLNPVCRVSLIEEAGKELFGLI